MLVFSYPTPRPPPLASSLLLLVAGVVGRGRHDDVDDEVDGDDGGDAGVVGGDFLLGQGNHNPEQKSRVVSMQNQNTNCTDFWRLFFS